MQEETPALAQPPAPADPFSTKIEAAPSEPVATPVETPTAPAEPAKPEDQLKNREEKLFDLNNLKSGSKKLETDFSFGGAPKPQEPSLVGGQFTPGMGPAPGAPPPQVPSFDKSGSAPATGQAPAAGSGGGFPSMFEGQSSGFDSFDTSGFGGEKTGDQGKKEGDKDWFNF